jgi:CIC family chloride channel protein
MSRPAEFRRRRRLVRLLRLRVWLFEHVRPNELQVTLFWAGVIGFLGALASVGFRDLLSLLHMALTGYRTAVVESFQHLAWWQRLTLPALGGVMAGLAILLGTRLSPRKSSTDYMEAVVLGDGVVPARLSLAKSASALFSIASGASIGREGPMVQLSAMLASLVGRARRTPTLQLRVLVACGAAAGIASAYNAPIGGALFVAEIVLHSMAMETFGPLVFSSVVATLTVHQFLGGGPIYPIQVPVVRLQSPYEMALFLGLGLVAGVAAPWFLRLLRASERWFTRLPLPIYMRLGLGGLIVGTLAVVRPEVSGNGYTVITEMLHGQWFWQTIALILVLKVAATAASFGSGAVGGVFTPSLFTGACIGYLFFHGAQFVWPGPPLVPNAFALVGMGAFLAAVTHAPIMAIIMLFEMSLDYQIILPLMLACVVAHYTCNAFEPRSIYAEAQRRKGAGFFHQQLSRLLVSDLMKLNPIFVHEGATFGEIAKRFISNRFNYLYVVDEGHVFLGVISVHDIKPYLGDPELAEVVIARDILRESFPTIPLSASLSEALTEFSQFDGERLPVVTSRDLLRLEGSVSKRDLMLALAERVKQVRYDDV